MNPGYEWVILLGSTHNYMCGKGMKNNWNGRSKKHTPDSSLFI
jgi:hypothetical protein